MYLKLQKILIGSKYSSQFKKGVSYLSKNAIVGNQSIQSLISRSYLHQKHYPFTNAKKI